MKAEQCFVLALWYSVGIQLSKDDESITSIFIAEATLGRISSDGIGSLISFSASSFRVLPYPSSRLCLLCLSFSRPAISNHTFTMSVFWNSQVESPGVMEGLYPGCLCHHFPVNFGISFMREHWTQLSLEMWDVLCFLTKEYSFLFPFKLQEWN